MTTAGPDNPQASSTAAVRCAACGSPLDELPNLPEESRTPCPGCGATSRSFDVTVDEAVSAQDYMNLTQIRDDRVIGFAETARDNRASGATLGPFGAVEMTVSGSPSQGEEDTGAVCELLRSWLNQQGSDWLAAGSEAEPADCVLVDGRDPKVTLHVQVVRALVDPIVYRELAQHGQVRRLLAPAEAADELRGAIDHKADALPTGRAMLALALDATRVPGLAFDNVVHEFRDRHCRDVSAYGFRAIWLVGPQARLIWRLDIAVSPGMNSGS